MPVFIDYRYTVNPVPVAGGWAAIRPNLTREHPPAIGTPTRYPREENVEGSGVDPAALWWIARTTGHGDQVQMAARWLLKGKALKAIDISRLNAYTNARTDLLISIFAATQNPLQHTRLAIDPIYELLDPSEKNTLSYQVGCAITACCCGAALATRYSVAAGAMQFQLFHLSLLRAHATLFHTVDVITSNGAQPDFIGFDNDGLIHIFESKAALSSGGYTRVLEGIEQVRGVVGIRFPYPTPTYVNCASRNVCLSFLSRTVVKEWVPGPLPPAISVLQGVRCAFFEYVDPGLMGPPNLRDSKSKELLQALLGLQILQYWIVLYDQPRSALDRIWDVFQIAAIKNPIYVAIPKLLVDRWTTMLEPFFVKNEPRLSRGPSVAGLQDTILQLGKTVLDLELAPVEEAGQFIPTNFPWVRVASRMR